MRNTRTFLVAAAVVGSLALTACGNDSDSGGSGGHHDSAASSTASSTAAAHNDQDMAFAQGMVPHHQQALEMAKLAADRASSPQVKDLAARIEKAQDPEIQTMNGWMKSWNMEMGNPSPMPSMSGMGGMAGMDGMMSDKDMTELKNMSGKEFDTMFLTMMIEHHNGAIEMAKTEKAKGSYAPAVSMAGDIISGQSAEITEMNQLLGKK
ncbi:DUF305 domain-containing protein [Streptomyces sp. NPDC005648]|uniref:DUF305 domain-containing protein n=1 Tax=Streptomyces sp. NPDC005648 TaxID=3157044 RepID=UPI0033A115B7